MHLRALEAGNSFVSGVAGPGLLVAILLNPPFTCGNAARSAAIPARRNRLETSRCSSCESPWSGARDSSITFTRRSRYFTRVNVGLDPRVTQRQLAKTAEPGDECEVLETAPDHVQPLQLRKRGQLDQLFGARIVDAYIFEARKA